MSQPFFFLRIDFRIAFYWRTESHFVKPFNLLQELLLKLGGARSLFQPRFLLIQLELFQLTSLFFDSLRLFRCKNK